MSNTSFLYRMPAGIPGDVTRAEHSTVEPQIMDAATPVTVFGVPVKVVSGKIQPMGSGDVGTGVYGLLVRPYPTQNAVAAEAIAAATPSTVNHCDVLRRGYMTVKTDNYASAAKDGQVYFRNLVGSPAGTIGTIDAVDGDNTVELTGAIFMGEADSDGNVEISYNI